jgi:hypothetical protein
METETKIRIIAITLRYVLALLHNAHHSGEKLSPLIVIVFVIWRPLSLLIVTALRTSEPFIISDIYRS